MQSLHDSSVAGPVQRGWTLNVPKGSISDELLIKALQPLSILQIGLQPQLLGGGRGQLTVCKVRSLEQALGLLAKEEFDAIILGPDLADAWPMSAYERLAEAAGSTPVVVKADPVEPMIMVKRRQDRADDVIVSSATPPLFLERMTLAAVLRNRALAASPGTQIG
jgi:DNA-binding NarL/FixJ family response regulator